MSSFCRIFCVKTNNFLKKTNVLNSEFFIQYSRVFKTPNSKLTGNINISSVGKIKAMKQNIYNLQNNIQTLSSVQLYPQKTDDEKHVEKSNILVYEAPLKTRVKIVKMLSLSSTTAGFCIFPIVMNDLWKVNPLMTCAAGAMSLFFLSTPFMLDWITRRYVLDLYFDSETKTFTARTFNLICQIKKTTFEASDVVVPDLPGMLSSIIVKGKPLFVDANMIKDPDAYSHMMGYDIPLDITLNTGQKSENDTDVENGKNETRKN